MYLREAYTIREQVRAKEFPWTLPIFAKGIHFRFRAPVTFFVGENGSGKSTLLEAIAIKAGFIVATHSPILLAFPDAEIYAFSGEQISKIRYEETEHYRTTRNFLNAPERFLEELCRD